jgi:hypothetical protein
LTILSCYAVLPTPSSLPSDIFPIVVCVIIAVAVIAFFAGRER